MSKRAQDQTGTPWQLPLLMNAERIANLDAKSRAAVVNLLGRLLRDAAQTHGREATDDEA